MTREEWRKELTIRAEARRLRGIAQRMTRGQRSRAKTDPMLTPTPGSPERERGKKRFARMILDGWEKFATCLTTWIKEITRRIGTRRPPRP